MIFFNQLYAKRQKLETYEPRKVKDELMEKGTLGFSRKSAKLKAAGAAGAQDRQRTRTGAGTGLDTRLGQLIKDGMIKFPEEIPLVSFLDFFWAHFLRMRH